VESILQASTNSLSAKSTTFGVGEGSGVGVESGMGVDAGVGVATIFEAAEQASMVTNSSTEKETSLVIFIFAPIYNLMAGIIL